MDSENKIIENYKLFLKTGNGVYKAEARGFYNLYKSLGGTKTLKEIIGGIKK